MSVFGASLTVSRIDGQPIDKNEIIKIKKVMKAAAKKLKLRDGDDQPFPCDFSRMQGNKALFMASASSVYKIMGEDIMNDMLEGDMDRTKKLVTTLKKEFPKIYSYEIGTQEW